MASSVDGISRTERLSGFEVDDQLIFGRLPDRALGVTMLPLSRPSKAVDMPDRGSYWGPGLNSPSCSTWPRQGRPSVRWSRRAMIPSPLLRGAAVAALAALAIIWPGMVSARAQAQPRDRAPRARPVDPRADHRPRSDAVVGLD